jgi:hypothetical protein
MKPELIDVAIAIGKAQEKDPAGTLSYLAFALGTMIGVHSPSIDDLLKGIKFANDAVRATATDTHVKYEKFKQKAKP